VLSRIPNSTYRIYGKTAAPVRDLKGLWLTPDAALADAPPLDILHVSGGCGQEALMKGTEALGWMRQARAAFSPYAQAPCSVARLAAQGTPGDDPRGVVSVRWALRLSCAATRPHKPSNFTWSMRRSCPSTAARPRRPRYWIRRGNSVRAITARREETARRVATKLDSAVPTAGRE
jgi:hypothetical protein